MRRSPRKRIAYRALIPLCCLGLQAAAGEVYRPIKATMTDRTITLTGHDLTIEQLVDIACHGAVVVSAARCNEPPTRLAYAEAARGSCGLSLQRQADQAAKFLDDRRSHNAGKQGHTGCPSRCAD
jgi:hypothetical protein